jgi:flagellar biosynthesis/type III secretory pathway M-ring protein FliF/YscJ
VSASDNAGFLAFVAFAVLAVALWFLMRNMNARMRRMSYRQRAAHRGRDDPQATQEDLRDEADGDDLPGAEDPDEPSGS